MHVLYPFPEPLPLAKARGIQVVHTVRSLAEAGARVSLAYVPVAGEADLFSYYGLARPPGVELLPMSRRLPGWLGRLHLHSNRFFLCRLVAWLNRQKPLGNVPDVILVRHLKLAHGLLSAVPWLPMAYEAHELFADTAPATKHVRLAAMEAKVLREAGSVIAISKRLALLLAARYDQSRHMPVIPSATRYEPDMPIKDWSAPGKRIVYAGSFYPWKGVDDLVAAAEHLPECEIDIIGGDPGHLGRLASLSSGAGAVIRFLGQLPHERAVERIRQACIAVLPNRAGSVSEFTSPLKLFEYMAAGCAIVASDLPVFREVLGSEDVQWFAPGNTDSLAAAIAALADQPHRAARLGQRMHDIASAYSWESRARMILAAMADAIAQRDAAR